MNFKLEKIVELSGAKASVYSVLLQGEETSLFEQFLTENETKYPEEVEDIVKRLFAIGKDVGAREQFFKLNEGLPGDLVCALYDVPDSNLRLFGMRFGTTTIILGGGGPKGKDIRAWQEDEKLSIHGHQMIAISKQIHERMKERELRLPGDWNDFSGDLEFYQGGEDE